MVVDWAQQKREIEDRIVTVLNLLLDGHIPEGSGVIRRDLIVKRGIPGSLIPGDVRKHKTFQRGWKRSYKHYYKIHWYQLKRVWEGPLHVQIAGTGFGGGRNWQGREGDGFGKLFEVLWEGECGAYCWVVHGIFAGEVWEREVYVFWE